MAKAIQGFYWDGTFYDVDDEVPDEVAGKVSSNVVSDQPEVDTAQFDGDVSFEAAVEVRVKAALESAEADKAAAVEAAVEDAVTGQIERERAAVDALAAGDPYDPAAYKADEVHGYLSGLDTDTVAGADEYDRVVEAEKADKDRSTAIPSDDES